MCPADFPAAVEEFSAADIVRHRRLSEPLVPKERWGNLDHRKRIADRPAANVANDPFDPANRPFLNQKRGDNELIAHNALLGSDLNHAVRMLGGGADPQILFERQRQRLFAKDVL